MVTSRKLSGVKVSKLAQNARDVDLIPTLHTIFPIFITPMTLVSIYLHLLCNLSLCIMCKGNSWIMHQRETLAFLNLNIAFAVGTALSNHQSTAQSALLNVCVELWLLVHTLADSVLGFVLENY